MQDTNITTLITQTINTLCNNLFSSIDNSIYPILDNLIFINSDIIKTTSIENILGTSSSNGLLILANALLVAFVIYYSVRLLFSYYTSSETQSPLRFFVRAVIFGILMNSSFFICEQILSLVNFITVFILDLGNTLFDKDINFLSLINTINSNLTINTESINVFSIDGIIKTIVSLGIFNLLLSYSLRYVMIKIMVLLCPFAFLCLIDKSTEAFFKSWIKSLFSLLVLQILVSIILILPHAINIEITQNFSDLFNKLTLVGTIYALFKANDFIKELMGGISTNVNLGISNIKTLLTKM